MPLSYFSISILYCSITHNEGDLYRIPPTGIPGLLPRPPELDGVPDSAIDAVSLVASGTMCIMSLTKDGGDFVQ